MTRQDALAELGVQAIRRLSEHTTVVEFVGGGTRPITDLELRMWKLIQLLRPKE